MAILKSITIKEVKQYVADLIRGGYVDANDNAFDGVRAIYQLLHGLPRTGATCSEIAKIEAKHSEEKAR